MINIAFAADKELRTLPQKDHETRLYARERYVTKCKMD